MTQKNLKNVAASVRQRLTNKAKNDHRPFAELLQYYAMERFLYRLSNSEHKDNFILKDALMLRAWEAPMARPTHKGKTYTKTWSPESAWQVRV